MKALALALMLGSTPALALDVSSETPSQNVEIKECTTITAFAGELVKFFSYMDPPIEINLITGPILNKYKAQMRANGASESMTDFDAIQWAAYYDEGKGPEKTHVGVVFFKNGCLQDVVVVTVDEWAVFVKKAINIVE